MQTGNKITDIQFIGYDKGDNINIKVNGEEYKLATAEFYGGFSVYGICYPGNDFFTFLSRDKKTAKFWDKIKTDVFNLLPK